MRSGVYFLLTLEMMAVDVAMANVALSLAYYVRFQTGLFIYLEYHPWQAYLSLAVIDSLVLPLVFALRGYYRPRRYVSRLDELQRVFGGVSIATVVAVAASALLPARDVAYSRPVLALAWVLGIALIWVGRGASYGLQRLLQQRWLGETNVLIVGTGEMGRVILDKIHQSPRLGYRPVGLVSDHDAIGSTPLDGLPVLGNLDQVAEVVRLHGIQEVIIAEPALSRQRIMDIVSQCDRERVGVKVFPDVFQIISSQVSIDDLHGLPMVSVRDVALRGWKLGIKRAVDIVFSAGVLICLSLPMLLVGLLIKLTSPGGPAFLIQERVGLDGKNFRVIKFRTMIPDAEAATGPVWAQAGDPRVTPLGRFLRRFSLDELPQFINVLIGEMSVVGPRPERPYFVEQFSQRMPRYLERHREKAGLTGWAQVNGLRGNVSIEERTAYDLWYVENWTLWLDFKIVLRTLFIILWGRNAY